MLPRTWYIFALLCTTAAAIKADTLTNSKDLYSSEDDDIGRKRNKKRRPSNPCGREENGKFFGFYEHTKVEVLAPVNNYYLSPCAPAYAPPVQYVPIGGHGGHVGHGGHGGGHIGTSQISQATQFPQFPLQSPYPQQPIQQVYPQQPMRPIGMLISAAASGLADYVSNTRPRKIYKQFNRQVNSVLKPIYRLF